MVPNYRLDHLPNIESRVPLRCLCRSILFSFCDKLHTLEKGGFVCWMSSGWGLLVGRLKWGLEEYVKWVEKAEWRPEVTPLRMRPSFVALRRNGIEDVPSCNW